MIIHDLFPIFYQTAIVVNYSNPTNSYLGESLGGSSPESEVTRNHSYFTIYKWEDHNPFTDGNHNSNIGGSMGFRLAIHKWNHPIFMGINHCHGWFTTVRWGGPPAIQKSMSHFSSAAMAFMAFSCIDTGAASPVTHQRRVRVSPEMSYQKKNRSCGKKIFRDHV